MREVKIVSNKSTRVIKIPESWQEVTTHQFVRLMTEWDSKDLIKLFSILTGVEYTTLSSFKDETLEMRLILSTKFVYESPMNFKDLPPPLWLDFEGKQIRIPALLGSLSIGQSIHARQEIEKAKIYEEVIPIVTAIYLQPIIDNAPFDFHKAQDLEKRVLEMPIVTIYPIGFFLLRRLNGYGKNILSLISSRIISLLSRSTQREVR